MRNEGDEETEEGLELILKHHDAEEGHLEACQDIYLDFG